jgi:hypothetical protein
LWQANNRDLIPFVKRRRRDPFVLTLARAGVLCLAFAICCACLALATLSHAQGSPVPGGTVPSTLTLSLGEPSLFRRVGRTSDGRNVYLASIRAEVSTTDIPTSLSLGLDAENPLRLWRKPLASAPVRIRLRRVAANRRALAHTTTVVTLTAGGP